MENRSNAYEKIVSEFGKDWANLISEFSPVFKLIDRVADPERYNYGFGGGDNVFPETVRDAQEWARNTKKMFLSYGIEKGKEILKNREAVIECGDGWSMPVDWELTKLLKRL